MKSLTAVHIYHNPTGARFFAAPMVERLIASGFPAELWCDGSQCSWFGAQPGATEGSAVRHLPSDLSVNPLRSCMRLLRLICWLQKSRPQVVHAHLLRGSLLPLLAAWIVRVPRRVYHNHGLSHLGYRGPLRWALRCLERLNRAAATHLLLVSGSNRDSAAEDGLGEGGTVLADGSAVGIDATRFDESHCGPAQKRARRESYGISPQTVVLGYAGRAAVHKGLDTLVEAWERSSLAANKGAMTLLAGVRDHELRALAGRVPPGMLCLGPLNDMPGFYAMCDLIVLPSRYEGFGYALLEGAAAGLPGIGSDVSGIRTAIVDGETGLLVPPLDPSALAETMTRLVNDPALRSRLGNAARLRATTLFTQERVLDALVSFYRDELRVDGGDTP